MKCQRTMLFAAGMILVACADSNPPSPAPETSTSELGLREVSERTLGQESRSIAIGPEKLTVKFGSVSEQPLSVLAARDQAPGQDQWDSFKEFYVDRTGFQGIFQFRLPGGLASDTIDGLSLEVNYRGPHKSYQAWTWALWDGEAKRWVQTGDNGDVGMWVWSHLQFAVAGNPRRFLGEDGSIAVRYQSLSTEDASDLDSMTIVLETSVGAVPEHGERQALRD